MSQLTDKVKDRVDGLGKQLGRIDAAGRGLLVKASEEGSRQLEELVKEGEAQLESGNTIAAQIKSSVKLDADPKEMIKQVRFAAIGLLSKVKAQAEKLIDDMVKQAEVKEEPKVTPKKPQAVKKSTKTKEAA